MSLFALAGFFRIASEIWQFESFNKSLNMCNLPLKLRTNQMRHIFLCRVELSQSIKSNIRELHIFQNDSPWLQSSHRLSPINSIYLASIHDHQTVKLLLFWTRWYKALLAENIRLSRLCRLSRANDRSLFGCAFNPLLIGNWFHWKWLNQIELKTQKWTYSTHTYLICVEEKCSMSTTSICRSIH